MSRNPYAAQTLLDEVRKQHAKASFEREGDPDGLGVYRSFKFDKASSKTLAKVLPLLSDERIESFEEKSGQVIVTFSPRTVADQRTPFSLADAKTVADAEPSA